MSRSSGLDRQQIGITLVRLIVGVVFVMHGGQKWFVNGPAKTADMFAHIGIPVPYVAAVLASTAEFGGGILLLLGLFTRWAAAFIGFTMLVAVVKVHLSNGFFLPHGFEYALTLLVLSLALVLTGSGEFAVDRMLHGTRA